MWLWLPLGFEWNSLRRKEHCGTKRGIQRLRTKTPLVLTDYMSSARGESSPFAPNDEEQQVVPHLR